MKNFWCICFFMFGLGVVVLLIVLVVLNVLLVIFGFVIECGDVD